MKSTIIVAATITAFTCSFAQDAPRPELDVAAEVMKVKVQEFSHALAELKLQEIALTCALPVDNAKLASVRAQQTAISQELLKLSIAPLEFKLKQCLEKGLAEGHRTVLELRKEIETRTKAMNDEATAR